MRNFRSIGLALIMAALIASPAMGDVYIYDGFEAGGSSPAAGQYNTGASSDGTDWATDALYDGDNNTDTGQSPDVTGFSGSQQWTGGASAHIADNDGLAGSVYYQAIGGGLDYTDSQSKSLVTTAGGVRHIHSSSPERKGVARSADEVTTTPGQVSWFSVLMMIEGGADGWGSTAQTTVFQNIYDENEKLLSVGVNASGQLTAEAKQTVTNGETYSGTGPSMAEGIAHMMLVRLEDDGGTDTMHVWLDPDLDSEPALNTADITLDNSAGGSFYVAGNSDYKLDAIGLSATLQNGDGSGNAVPANEDFAYFDEVRVGETFADVTPIPEPATMSLLAIGGLALGLRRRRR